MSDPQEATNSTSDSAPDDVDASTHRTEDPARGSGSDVGGPAGSIQSTTQDALSGHTAGDVDDDDTVENQAESGGV